jgi:hypothetical protein
MHLIEHIKQKPIARETTILLAAITLSIANAGHGGVHRGGVGFGLLSVQFADSQTSIATRAR